MITMMAATSTKRRKRKLSEPNLKAKATGILLMVASILYLYFLWRTQSFLDTLEEGGRFRIPGLLFRKHAKSEYSGLVYSETEQDVLNQFLASAKASHPVEERLSSQRTVPKQLTPQEAAADAEALKGDKFLIFVPIEAGQGTGNLIAGLLATHLLALEFNRTVCVSPLYETFLDVFEPAHPVAMEKCPKLLMGTLPAISYSPNDDIYLRLITYFKAPDECELKATLASNVPILYVESNTYPRWPAVPDNFFFTNYRAKAELLKALPYKKAPTTVVHLREPDGKTDARKGLDNNSLKALGKTLPRDTYLVTNRVEWYDKFEKEYGWSHPEWNEVIHSFYQKSWGLRGEKSKAHMVQTVDRETQNLQMWCDWYTILTAKFVYHTHSDFSISAIHWQNLDSYTIMGLNAATGKLNLEEESWRVSGETERLVDRTLGGKGTSDLRLCKSKRVSQSSREFSKRRKRNSRDNNS
jgi:hypothetical protein